MFYIVQKNVFREENYDKIFDALERLDLEYEVVDCRPFIEEVECSTTRKDVFPFGSVKLSRLSSKMDWVPGSFYGGNHDYNIYSKFYKENLLNYDSKIQSLKDEIIWEGSQDVKFIRPCKDSKLFTGALFTKIKWEDRLLQIKSYKESTQYDFEDLIQISSPKVIYKEARVWVVDGKIVTSSYYHFKHNVEWREYVDPEGLEFVEEMIKLYQVADAFVMDICLTPDGWKIVEINCINCSGFYMGDLQKILIALEDKWSPINKNRINEN
jgi:hypothetical protein